MARPRPALARSPSRAVGPRPTAAVAITHWRDDATVMRLTEKLKSLVETAARRSADDVVAIGLQLERIRKRLGHGHWRRWIDDNAGFARTAATNYIELAAWSKREPGEFAGAGRDVGGAGDAGGSARVSWMPLLRTSRRRAKAPSSGSPGRSWRARQ